jgi:hypothetical protein
MEGGQHWASFGRSAESIFMDTRFCSDVHNWITELDDLTAHSAPSPALCAHVASCARCRGALLLLVADLLAAPLELAPLSCEQCQDDLAAYIDLERDEGTGAALRAYPQLWWHLWTCVDCAESYRMVLALHEAEANNILPPVPLSSLVGPSSPRRPALRMPAITLRRALLRGVLVPHFGASMGGHDEDAIIYEADDEGYEIRTSVRRHNGQWSVIVALDPPIVGAVVVAIGAARFRAQLDPHGQATIGPLPGELLASVDGPDMDIRIEPDGDEDSG